MSSIVSVLIPPPVLDRIRSARRHYRNQNNRSILWRRLASFIGQRKIILAITPPPRLTNVGDHAQVVAIREWIGRHFPGLPILELDKDETIFGHDLLRRVVTPDDLIFLQSGGNLGDRGIWSETGRRLMIGNFPDLPIVSLPQTIYWSDTEHGRQERQLSRDIYHRHPRLTIIARDHVSAELAAELSSRVLTAPDFALALPTPPVPLRMTNASPRVLLVLRHDTESLLNSTQHQKLASIIGFPTTRYDTVLPDPISLNEQTATVEWTLRVFAEHDAIVTDRFHGLVFAVVCRKPVIVLPTIDHKISAGLRWFEDIPFVGVATRDVDVRATLDRMLRVQDRTTPDWRGKHFATLPEKLGLL